MIGSYVAFIGPLRNSMRFTAAFFTAPASLALLASFAASISAAETPATFSADSAAVIGGAFSVLGEPRLALLATTSGAFIGEPVLVSGVRASLIIGRTCVIGGDFRSVNGQPRAGLARLDLQGRLDPDWHPAVTGMVTSLASVGEALYIGGSFTAVDGLPHGNLARVSLRDGSVGAWQADTDGTVHAIAATRSAVVIGGAFSTVADEPHIRLASLAVEDGKPLATFLAGADAEVRALAIRGDQLYLGGQFARIGSEDRVGLARIALASGAVDADWRADVEGAVFTISAVWDKLYLGGAFSQVAGNPRSNCARLTLNSGALDPWMAETDGHVTAIAEVDGGRILLGGNFTTVSGVPASGLVALDAEHAAPVPSWQGPALSASTTPGGLALAGNALCVAASTVQGRGGSGVAWIRADGSLDARSTVLDGTRPHVLCAAAHQGKLYLGGDFTMVDGQPRMYLARLDLATGRLDDKWRCDGNGPVRTLAVLGDSLLVGGDFTRFANADRAHLAQIAMSDAALQPLQAQLNGTLMALLPTPQGLLIGGNFTQVGSAPRYGLARLQGTDGALDTTFTADLMDGSNPGTVHALQRLDAQHIVVGGRFTSVNGAAAGHLAMLQADEPKVAPWALADGPVFALAATNGRLAIGGGFTTIAGSPRGHVAQLDPTTGKTLEWRADVDAEVRSLATVRGDLWLTGDFTTIAGHNAQHLARCAWTDGAIHPITGSDERIDLVFPLPTATAP
jgi:hypothetical protein